MTWEYLLLENPELNKTNVKKLQPEASLLTEIKAPDSEPSWELDVES